MNEQLNTTDILADLESYFADPPATHALDLDTQAAITLLIWEVRGIVDIAAATKQSPNTARGLARLAAIANLLTNLLQPDDAALDLAGEQVAALPWGATLQAILTHAAGKFVSERDYREVVASYGD
jgi:hypothetical protein